MPKKTKTSLEDYVKCILPLTVPSNADAEFLKLFAVILRTKTLYNSIMHKAHGIDVCTDGHCSLYRGRAFEDPLSSSAVDATRSQIITYDNGVINPIFNESLGATGASFTDVFGKEVPYLQAVANADKNAREWKVTVSPRDLMNSIVEAGYTEISANVASVTVNSYAKDSIYVKSITVTDILGNSLTLEGTDSIVAAFGHILPSGAFCVGKAGQTVERAVFKDGTIAFESVTLSGGYGVFVFEGSADGNGVGLSILGAKEDIGSGMTYSQVISKYYNEVTLTEIGG